MRSLAEQSTWRRLRLLTERTVRVALILALIVAIRHALFAMNERPSLSAKGGEQSLRGALADWSTASAPSEAHIEIDSTPSAATRGWTAALTGAGTKLSWSSPMPPIGVAVEPVADPKGRSRIWISAPRGSRVALEDSLGAMDSVTVRSIGASAGPISIHGAVLASAAGATATAARSDSLMLGAALVIGRAGWEGKFIAASLEEYGWTVSARLSVSPGNDATLGSPGVNIDGSLYSAVIVIDSSASRYSSAIERYVKGGGGLVAIGEGASSGALRSLLPGVAGVPEPPGEITSAHPRNGLALRSIGNLSPDAIVLERRGSRVAVAARRVGRGRVIQVGYDDSWRWRMAGSGDAVEDYRNWISSVVSGAAYAPRVPMAGHAATSSAPMAEIYSALGPPSAVRAGVGYAGSEALLLDLFIVAIVAHVLETALRRLDGRP